VSFVLFLSGLVLNDAVVVYLEARHIVTGHQVAMKIIQKQKILEVKTKQRVRREYEYLRALRHPHIIKL
jgi:serine/threonine protein kinase